MLKNKRTEFANLFQEFARSYPYHPLACFQPNSSQIFSEIYVLPLSKYSSTHLRMTAKSFAPNGLPLRTIGRS